jgi:hypothetical protein
VNPITYEALQRNPELLQALLRQARRERAEAVHRLIIEPIMSLFTRSQPKAPRPMKTRLAAP